jgi:8-oxo-dGTP pyrophosphatase MutT (NUDIX family)
MTVPVNMLEPMQTEPHHWTRHGSTLEADCRIFKVQRVHFTHDIRGSSGDFFVIDCADWVHVLALTSSGKLIMVKQFRFGTENLSWEIPGGLMERGEHPVQAAERELLEETGYTGDPGQLIGSLSPNPAIQSNRCYFVLIKNAKCQSEPDWDEHEEILTEAIPVQQAMDWVHDGTLFHSLSAAAMLFLQRHL